MDICGYIYKEISVLDIVTGGIVEEHFFSILYAPPPFPPVKDSRSKMNEKVLKKMTNNMLLIKRLYQIQNSILANASYQTKEMESQIANAQKNGNMTEKEEQIIIDIWTRRNKIANENMQLYDELFKEIDEGGNKEDETNS